jgi:hypothetical protein
MLAWSKSHCKEVHVSDLRSYIATECEKENIRHGIQDFLSDLLPTFFTVQGFWQNDILHELADGCLESSMVFAVVGTREAITEPCWLCIGYLSYLVKKHVI